jgi:glutamate dehydrogenase (NAD(P)+)
MVTTFIESVMQNLDEASNFLELDAQTKEAIKMPMREVTVTIPVRMDDGTIRRFVGHRILHNNALGYGKGGIRYHQDETIDTVRSLASLMCWKVSLAGLPLGGAKGGIVVDPKKLSVGELERLSRGYIRAIADLIGPEQDVPAPDVNSNPQIMSWMMDEYEVIKRKSYPGVITGKPIILGGSLGRDNATGMGGMYALREAAKELNIDLGKSTFAIQGFGNVGSHAAKLAYDMFGMKLIAVSDITGGIVSLSGHYINPYKLEEYKNQTGSFGEFPNTFNFINPEELLELSCDVLIPAALENVITSDNAKDIKAKIILELANGPTTPEADEILYENDIHVIPDFLANSGGVIVSHLENVQNRMAHYWSEAEVYKFLDAKITDMYHGVYNLHKEKGINMRKAAFSIAISRVVEAMKLRGMV